MAASVSYSFVVVLTQEHHRLNKLPLEQFQWSHRLLCKHTECVIQLILFVDCNLISVSAASCKHLTSRLQNTDLTTSSRSTTLNTCTKTVDILKLFFIVYVGNPAYCKKLGENRYFVDVGNKAQQVETKTA